ncbi:MAG: VCBS repeat-containing protein [Chitinophagaceae bacterium]
MKSNRLALILVAVLGIVSCKNNDHLFRLVSPEKSGIDFTNTITINDTINILESEFTYNGGGVAVGDLNGDGLQDIYFAGNQVQNKLYINKGELKFEEVIEKAGAHKTKGQWSSGVTFVDINSDGKQDIYVCNTMIEDSAALRDLLFINQGNNQEGIPQFKELGEEYGILDNTHNSISTFFDYDLDGDLDLFIAVNFIDVQYPNQFLSMDQRRGKGVVTRDLLYRNDFDSTLGHAVFTDVSLDAGIDWGGYSHSAMIHDFNKDGYPDIYVANDYLSTDLIYINNQNGTFTNRISEIFKHESYSSMGSDIADVNNDGLEDLFAVEMLPADNKRKKVNMNANNYNHYLFTEQYQYEYQFVRNMFQLNQGINPKTKLPLFSDIAFLAGVEATDWSWSPLFADFDNDGNRDLLITNGFPKDIIDHDFGAFRKSISSSMITRAQLLDMIPEVKIPNFIFKNNGDLTFSDKSKEWGINLVSFTNGTSYADLDNDGDLDIITNNIDDPAFLFENTLYTRDKNTEEQPVNFLRIDLRGPQMNPQGFGATVTIWNKGAQQLAQSHCVRGYLSKSENFLHFGLGASQSVDSIVVVWSDGKKQTLSKQNANQVIVIDYKNANEKTVPSIIPKPLFFEEIDPASIGIDYIHEENDFIDFNLQKTLPHKFSQYGPAIAVGDVNGDGLDDIALASSSRFQGPVVLMQQPNGKFTKKILPIKTSELKKEEDMGLLLFDADGDGDNDLYITRGSYQHDPGSNLYQDVLCENDGKGNFVVVSSALPVITASGQNTKAADFDGDGDLDLFVGGRVDVKAYPKPGQSLLLRNDSKPGKLSFTDVTKQWSSALQNVGMVSDFLWTDFNNDNKPDLLIASEWSPLLFYKNTGSSFEKIDASKEISDASGWWNSLLSVDVDQDGDMDYVAGNFGLNQYFKCSSGEPLRIYSKDFDKNGSYDAFISCYFPDSTGKRQEYFYHSKDDMQKQLILIRRKFEFYGDYGKATVKDVFTPEEMKDVNVLTANYMKSVWIENLGNQQFKMHELPMQAQFAPLYGMQAMDVNGDKLTDLVLTGNDFGMETSQGRADAFNGLVLLNDGNKKFKSIGFEESGFLVPGDARALAAVNVSGTNYLVSTENRKALRFFKMNGEPKKSIQLMANETKAMLYFSGNKKQKAELTYGSSFLSQTTRNYSIPNGVIKIELYTQQGKLTRTIDTP